MKSAGFFVNALNSKERWKKGKQLSLYTFQNTFVCQTFGYLNFWVNKAGNQLNCSLIDVSFLVIREGKKKRILPNSRTLKNYPIFQVSSLQINRSNCFGQGTLTFFIYVFAHSENFLPRGDSKENGWERSPRN